jgi:hypothetical protein
MATARADDSPDELAEAASRAVIIIVRIIFVFMISPEILIY